MKRDAKPLKISYLAKFVKKCQEGLTFYDIIKGTEGSCLFPSTLLDIVRVRMLR